jgi:hypothetical protein
MKKLIMALTTFVLILGLTACSDLCVGPECLIVEPETCEEGYELVDGECVEKQEEVPQVNCGEGTIEQDGECVVDPNLEPVMFDNMVPFTHLNGEGHETEKIMYVLMEFAFRDYVRYQVAYLSCTCRSGDVNFWNIAFFEIGRAQNEIQTISFGIDGEDGHYNAGMWGDSSGAPEQNGVTFEQFEASFFPWFIGKTSADLDGIIVWDNGEMYNNPALANTGDDIDQALIDEFAGSSVSTNNFLRIAKELLAYHEEKYGN